MADRLQNIQSTEENNEDSDVSSMSETSSDGYLVFEELEEEEEQVLMVVGPYMHEPDAVDATAVPPQRPDMEWRLDPRRLKEW